MINDNMISQLSIFLEYLQVPRRADPPLADGVDVLRGVQPGRRGHDLHEVTHHVLGQRGLLRPENLKISDLPLNILIFIL